MDTIIGIDLGTTNSEVAVIRDGRPVVLPDEDGDPILPSVVGLDPQGRLLVGKAGAEPVRAGARAHRSGRSSGRWARRSPSRSATRSTRRRRSRPSSCGRSSSAPRRRWAQPVSKAVITVPAFFNEGQRAGDPRGGRARRPGGRPDHQRADRRRADLRPPPARDGTAAGLRPGRRHVRRLDRPGRAGRRRDPRQPRRYPPRRRRLRPAAARLRLRRFQTQHGIDLRDDAVRPEPASSAPSRTPRNGSPSRPVATDRGGVHRREERRPAAPRRWRSTGTSTRT